MAGVSLKVVNHSGRQAKDKGIDLVRFLVSSLSEDGLFDRVDSRLGVYLGEEEGLGCLIPAAFVA